MKLNLKLIYKRPTMKSLKEHIYEKTLLEKYPYFGNTYLYEKKFMNDFKSNNCVLEKYGAFDGSIPLVNSLTDYIINCFNKIYRKDNKIDTITLNSDILESEAKRIKIKFIIFFDELEIIIVDRNSSSYLPDMSEYDKNRNRFKKVTILVQDNKINDPIELSSILVHELTHAYEDFKRNEKNLNITLKDLGRDPIYVKAKNNLKEKTHDDVEKLVSYLIYQLNKTEVNAIISEFSVILDKIYKDNIEITYIDALNTFKNSKKYKNLITTLSIIDNSKPIILDFIASYWNKMHNTSDTTNKCIKKIKYLLKRTLDKISETLPKIYFDFIESKKNDKLTNEGSFWDPNIDNLFYYNMNLKNNSFLKKYLLDKYKINY